MGFAWMIKMMIVCQFLVSFEVFKVVGKEPLGLDGLVYDTSVFI